MAQHKPTLIWSLRKIGHYPQIYLQTHDERTLHLSLFAAAEQDGYGFLVSRRDARLLAKRLLQCLEKTR